MIGFQKINLEEYPRRKHFEYFSSLQYPYVGVTSDVDVTDLIDVQEFRQRIHHGEIIQYDQCPTSHIELLENGTYCYCTLRHHMPLEEYVPYAAETRKRCRENGVLEEDAEEESMYFISTLPWLHYSALIQPVAGGEESNPRITWGKFQKDHNGREQMPVSVLAHHGLVDGIHIARFYQNLESQMWMLIGKGE